MSYGTRVTLKDGSEWVVFSDNDDGTVDLIPLDQLNPDGSYDPEYIATKSFSKTEIKHQL